MSSATELPLVVGAVCAWLWLLAVARANADAAALAEAARRTQAPPGPR